MATIVHLIRHPKSAASEKDPPRRQIDTEKIGIEGEIQAKLLAKRLKQFPIDVLLTSPLRRAYDAAKIVANHCDGLFPNKIDILREIKRPSLVEIGTDGQPQGIVRHSDLDRAYKAARGQAIRNHDMLWKFGPDDESQADLLRRAVEAKHWWLSEFFGQRIAVVSHSIFIATEITTMINGDRIPANIFFRQLVNYYPHFTGITTLKYEHGRWRLITFNDYSHLPQRTS